MAHTVRRYGDGDRDCRAGVRDGHWLRVAVPYGLAKRAFSAEMNECRDKHCLSALSIC